MQITARGLAAQLVRADAGTPAPVPAWGAPGAKEAVRSAAAVPAQQAAHKAVEATARADVPADVLEPAMVTAPEAARATVRTHAAATVLERALPAARRLVSPTVQVDARTAVRRIAAEDKVATEVIINASA